MADGASQREQGEAIVARDLSKAYRMWRTPSARLTAPLLDRTRRLVPSSGLRSRMERALAASYTDFHALSAVSFCLPRGEGLGVIGRNGSGKSTLLHILAGTLQPTSGSVTVNGRVAALLELGSGFNPEYTGRENVYLNASILGLTREELENRLDRIVAFADIGDFLDQPLKTYSSGMVVRLAFSVAISLDPDVLIVDEALSVGDVFFVQKCFKRVRELLDRGITLLFVSHDLAAVQNLCRRTILLDGGRVTFDGSPEEASSRYYASGASRPRSHEAGRRELGVADRDEEQFRIGRDEILAANILGQARARHGARELELVAAVVENGEGEQTWTTRMMDVVTFRILVRANRTIPAPSVGLHLHDRMHNLVFAAGTRQLGVPFPTMQAGDERIVTLELRMAVQPGPYTFSLGGAEPSEEGPNAGWVQDRHEGLGPLVVHADGFDTLPFYGSAQLPLVASVR
jgi:lipopolysaccharide transport system ATP-binding protein